MSNNLSKEQRKKNMKAIRSQSQLENMVSQALWKKGIRFRKNVRSLFGKPDISIQKYKVVIFIDSCFWHACPLHGNQPKSNKEFWEGKLSRNKQRDIEVNNYYIERNWYIKRIWEHELKEDFNRFIQELTDYINRVKRQKAL